MTKIKLPSKSKPKKKSKPKTKKNNLPAVSYDAIKEKYVAFRNKIGEIKQIQKEAFDRMFEFGELLIVSEQQVKQDYGTWAKFSEHMGIDSTTISRCKASVADFREHGADTLEKARKLLKSSGHTPTAKLMESNINRLLTDTKNNGEKETPINKSVKHERHIKEIRTMQERLEEIVNQHQPEDEIYEEAVHIKEFSGETINHLRTLDISQKDWTNQAYTTFCRNIGYDVVLGEPADQTEGHHISPKGDYGSAGSKIADIFRIPVSHDTHKKLHSGKIKLSEAEIADCHRWTMANFIMHTFDSDSIDNMPEAEYQEVN